MSGQEIEAFKERCSAAIIGFTGPDLEPLPTVKTAEGSSQTALDFEAAL